MSTTSKMSKVSKTANDAYDAHGAKPDDGAVGTGEWRRREPQDTRLSKRMSLMLRHRPELGPITLDAEGFCDLDELVRALARTMPHVSDEDVLRVVATDAKGRFEVTGGRIRAVYGHSRRTEPVAHDEAVPPARLFHGTSHRALASIMRDGLLPMRRQMVHLSTDVETAHLVGSRHDRDPIILAVDAQSAHEAGTRFYRATETTWLAERVEARFLKVMDA